MQEPGKFADIWPTQWLSEADSLPDRPRRQMSEAAFRSSQEAERRPSAPKPPEMAHAFDCSAASTEYLEAYMVLTNDHNNFSQYSSF